MNPDGMRFLPPSLLISLSCFLISLSSFFLSFLSFLTLAFGRKIMGGRGCDDGYRNLRGFLSHLQEPHLVTSSFNATRFLGEICGNRFHLTCIIYYLIFPPFSPWFCRVWWWSELGHCLLIFVGPIQGFTPSNSSKFGLWKIRVRVSGF